MLLSADNKLDVIYATVSHDPNGVSHDPNGVSAE